MQGRFSQLLILFAVALVSCPAWSQVRLELEDVSGEARGANPSQWRFDARSGTMNSNFPWGTANFFVVMPTVIDPSAAGSFRIRVTGTRGRYAPMIGLKGEVDSEPAAYLYPVAEPGETKDVMHSFKLTPRNYSPERNTLVFGVETGDGGPALLFRYRIVRRVGAPPTAQSAPPEATPGIVPTQGTFVGCFRDQGDPTDTRGRDLNGFAFSTGNMTGAYCQAECAKRGFANAGTQYSSWCFCGNEYGRSGPANNCNMSCSGNPQEICGGEWANTVFRIGGSNQARPPPPPPSPLNLTGRWSGNDGGTYYLRQNGNDLWWYGRSSDGGATWSNVFRATLQGARITGQWSDVPQGRVMSAGDMEIEIVSPDQLRASRRTGGFGGSEWVRQR